MTAVNPTRAALRDASFFRNPSTSKPVKYHVVVDDVGVGGCSIWTIKDRILDQSLALEDVPQIMRCMRPGCRNLWPAIERPPQDLRPGDDSGYT